MGMLSIKVCIGVLPERQRSSWVRSSYVLFQPLIELFLELYLALEDIDHTRTKTQSPQNHGRDMSPVS
jgi:hypothetical protein